MTFEEWIGDRIETMSSHEYAAEKAAWDAAYEQGVEDSLSVYSLSVSYMAGLKDASSRKLPEGYALVPVKPNPRMIIDMAWWCRELSLSTGDLVEFWESMVESAQELDDDIC